MSIICASYRFQKKYDILEKALLQEYDQRSKANNPLGQLYAALDLADFYSYGFIDYKKSLDYYKKAGEINGSINESGIRADEKETSDLFSQKKKTEIVYYKSAEGDYVLPRKYDHNEVARHVDSNRNRIGRVLEGQSGSENENSFPEIKTLMTNQYAYAIAVNRDVFDPEIFTDFENELLKTAGNYFKYRHKISKDEKSYYKYFNITRCLINSFDFSTLSESQCEKILKYIHLSESYGYSKDFVLQKAYLNFGKVLCMSRLKKHDDAIDFFIEFEKDVKIIEEKIRKYDEYLKEAIKEAEKEAKTKMLKAAGLAILTGLASVAVQNNISDKQYVIDPQKFSDHVTEVMGNVSTNYREGTLLALQREKNIAGESEYARGFNSLLNMDDQLQLFRAVGSSYHHTGNIEKSIFYHKESIKIINNLRSTISSERNRITFAGYKENLFNTLVDDLIAGGRSDEALFFAENSRSRAFVDLLGSRKDIVFKNDEVDNYIKNLRNIQISKDTTRNQIGVTDGQASYINNKERGMTVTKLKEARKESFSDPRELLSLVTVTNLKTDKMKELVPPGFSLIEYYISENGVYAWVIENGDLKFHVLPVTRNELEKITRSFYSNYMYSKDIMKVASAYHEKLFAPIEASIANTQIIVVEHRFLHSIPFDVFFDGNEFLVQKYSFSYIPSISVLEFFKSSSGENNSLIAFGNPEIDNMKGFSSLEGAEEEAIQIADAFPLKKVYLGKDATETAVRAEAKYYRTVHIACHGEFDGNNPLDSKLVLAGDIQNDGLLTARELYGFQINAELVTLSACRTGMSEVTNGDELLGLVRGFFFAGTSNLIASSWKVNDVATKNLMLRFYNYLKCGKPINKAIQLAKIDMIKSEKFSHPYYWAAFVLYGLGS